MNYAQSRHTLQQLFELYNFKDLLQQKKLHAHQITVDRCGNGSEISISFPGYKASPTVYDYRVDLTKNKRTTALSHTNIVTDIYNKIMAGGLDSKQLAKALIESAIEGPFHLLDIAKTLEYTPTPPAESLKKRVQLAHKNKYYNKAGNETDLTIEEFFKSLKWIVLQEDINYPISKKYEGRKMPYARYLETTFITQHDSHTLEEVISRTLSHSRPTPWKEMNYAFSDLIV